MTTPGRRPAGGRTRAGARPVAAASGKRLAPVVYEMLKERLLEGTYQAGERLSVETLKTEFEVSKQPVMEALHRLAADGLVEIVPQVGCRVVRLPAAGGHGLLRDLRCHGRCGRRGRRAAAHRGSVG